MCQSITTTESQEDSSSECVSLVSYVVLVLVCRVVTTKGLHKVLPNIKQVFVKVRQAGEVLSLKVNLCDFKTYKNTKPSSLHI